MPAGRGRLYQLITAKLMSLEAYNFAPITSAQAQFRREFSDFARVWQDTKPLWRDDRARQFEQQYLASLGPSLSRLSAALTEFEDLLRKAQTAVSDPGTGFGSGDGGS